MSASGILCQLRSIMLQTMKNTVACRHARATAVSDVDLRIADLEEHELRDHPSATIPCRQDLATTCIDEDGHVLAIVEGDSDPVFERWHSLQGT